MRFVRLRAWPSEPDFIPTMAVLSRECWTDFRLRNDLPLHGTLVRCEAVLIISILMVTALRLTDRSWSGGEDVVLFCDPNQL